uniref:Integrase catalytic domain-containing protein n=1 Tax=Amphiprion percula TaxID=161767 RepID=A0A3P8SHI7_AMPPE
MCCLVQLEIGGTLPMATHIPGLELFPLRTATAESISRILTQEIFTRWGITDYILSDRGSQFLSSIFQATCKTWNMSQKLTSAYHPQTNLTERVNRTLKTMIASFVGSQHKQWDKHLPEFRFALNSAVHESTGVTPAELNLCGPLRGPLDVVLQPQDAVPDSAVYSKISQLNDLKAFVSKNLSLARKRQKSNYDKHRRDMSFEKKDRVWLRAHPMSKAEKSFTAKLAPKWQGPYRILQQTGSLNYEVVLEDSGEDHRNVHISRLKPCYPTAEDMDELQRHQLQGIFEEETEVEEFFGFQTTATQCSPTSMVLLATAKPRLIHQIARWR